MTPTKEQLIRRLRGLSGILPGEDWQEYGRRQGGSWCGDGGHGSMTRNGIAGYASLDDMFADRPAIVVPWREVAQVVARGCVDGRREAYEEALRAYIEYAATPLPEPWLPWTTARERGLPEDWFHASEANQEHWARGARVHRELDATQDAILTAGLSREPVQAALW